MGAQPRLYALQSLQCPRNPHTKSKLSALDYQDMHREPREAGPVKTSQLIYAPKDGYLRLLGNFPDSIETPDTELIVPVGRFRISRRINPVFRRGTR